MRKFLREFALMLCVLASAVLLLRVILPADKIINKADYLSSACRIKTPEGYSGSGYVLPNLSVLTAKHVVDENDDRLISDSERNVRVILGNDVLKGTVVWPSSNSITKLDIAVIRVNSLRHFADKIQHIELAPHEPKFGDELFYIGFPADTQRPHLLVGFQSAPSDDFGDHRASILAWPGSSGSALLDSKNGNLVGILTSGMTVPPFDMFVPDWAEYIPAAALKKELPSWVFAPKPKIDNHLSLDEMFFIAMMAMGALMLIMCGVKWIQSR